MDLPETERADLAYELLASLPTPPPRTARSGGAWIAEIERRAQRAVAGDDPGGLLVGGAQPDRRASPAAMKELRLAEETIGKLLDATIDALADVGYARASVSQICSRAGVSHGALFCHFDSRLELIAGASAHSASARTARCGSRASRAEPHPPAGDYDGAR